MNVKFFGGPEHNKTKHIDDRDSDKTCIEFVGYKKYPSAIVMPEGEMFPTSTAQNVKMGRYWRTGDTDKWNNIIFAWSGWR